MLTGSGFGYIGIRPAALLVLVLAWGCGGTVEAPLPTEADPAHRAEVEAWKQRRDERLRAEDSWLTLVGLFWLEEGANHFGSGPDNDLVFPAPAPEHAGVFERDGTEVTLIADPAAGMTSAGEPVDRLPLASDAGGDPTVVRMGTMSFYVIDRSGRLGIRVKDSESRVRTEFTGIDCFPPDPAWRLEARFETYDPPKIILVPNVLGTTTEEQCTGAVVFEKGGQTHRIEAIGELGGELFLVFSDRTSGESTYGGGRFLIADPPDADGRLTLDFNMAYNPPCAFTPYATCPLPPEGNRLDIAVEAGEKRYGEAH